MMRPSPNRGSFQQPGVTTGRRWETLAKPRVANYAESGFGEIFGCAFEHWWMNPEIPRVSRYEWCQALPKKNFQKCQQSGTLLPILSTVQLIFCRLIVI